MLDEMPLPTAVAIEAGEHDQAHRDPWHHPQTPVLGLTLEEVTSFGESEVEFLPTGVRLTLRKGRAGLLRHRAFRDRPASDVPAPAGEDIIVNWPHREASEVVGQLPRSLRGSAPRLPHATDTLFVSASVQGSFTAVFGRLPPGWRRLVRPLAGCHGRRDRR
ncbi:hypothetical protein ACFYY1_35455 [Streptomyces sp. NPDC001890]|uniref:hypothetical protein n=1 Tax=Streptomyces sp. NPDC001890 TaxID=3364620 RepID=UPI0036AB6BEB